VTSKCLHLSSGRVSSDLRVLALTPLISGNWAGEPLESYEAILGFIRTTRSSMGFHCRARLDAKEYATGYKVTREAKKRIRLKPRAALPKWNYTIWPHSKPIDC